MSLSILSISHRWERIRMLALIEFKLRYYENKLGLLWALIKPVSLIVTYYIVFQIILNQGVPNYAVYLWSGLFIWQFFTESTSGNINILEVKQYLYTYTNMDKVEIYIAYLLSASISIAINFAIFLVGAMITGIFPSYHYLYFIIIVINLFILSFGITLILSNLFLLFKDIAQIWGIIVSLGFFLSPILYRDSIFSEKIPWLNYVNPIAGIINNTHAILFYNQSPDWSMILFDMVYAVIIFLVGYFLLRRLGPRAAELL